MGRSMDGCLTVKKKEGRWLDRKTEQRERMWVMERGKGGTGCPLFWLEDSEVELMLYMW